MSDPVAPSSKQSQRSQGPGMRFFAAGAGILVALGLVGGTMLYFKIELFQRMLMAAMMLALLGVLNVLIGFVFELVWAVRERRFAGIGIQIVTIAVLSVASMGARSVWVGDSVEGNAFVPLLGKHRDDPQVRAVFGRLGHDHFSSKEVESWSRHSIEVLYTKDGRIKRINLGSTQNAYAGPLPEGIMPGEKQEAVAIKLGIEPLPPGTTNGYFEVPSKNLGISIKEGRAVAAILIDEDLRTK